MLGVWAEKEVVDFFDMYDEDMIRQDAMKEMEISVKLHTDKIMREELHRLTEVCFQMILSIQFSFIVVTIFL